MFIAIFHISNWQWIKSPVSGQRCIMSALFHYIRLYYHQLIGFITFVPPVLLIEYDFSGQSHITVTLVWARMEERRGMWSSSLLCLALRGWTSKLGLKSDGRPHSIWRCTVVVNLWGFEMFWSSEEAINQPDGFSTNPGLLLLYTSGSGNAQDPPPPKEPWESPLERKARRHREKARGCGQGPGVIFYR